MIIFVYTQTDIGWNSWIYVMLSEFILSGVAAPSHKFIKVEC